MEKKIWALKASSFIYLLVPVHSILHLNENKTEKEQTINERFSVGLYKN